MDLLRREVPATSLVVAIDPGKAFNRVWVTTGERGLIGEPVSLPVLREGVDELERLIAASGVAGPPVIGMEATGALHRAWAAEIERRWPGSLRLFAPSETHGGAGQLGSRRFKTDDRDCAALVWLAAPGRRAARPSPTGSRRCSAAVASSPPARRRALKPLRQRLHDQLNALAPGPVGARRPRPRAEVADLRPAGRCWPARRRSRAAPPSTRSLQARAAGPHDRCDRRVLDRALEAAAGAAAATPSCAPRGSGATSLAGSACSDDIALADDQLEQLLADSRRAGPDDAARRRDRPRGGVRRATRCRSSASPTPSTSTRPPAWRRRATNPRRSRRRGRDQPHTACPSTATR